jgi:glycosyltransferase involved in cell wall biosynthesis
VSGAARKGVMNVLMICPDWFPFSAGLAQSCYELCERLQRRHAVRILVAKDAELDAKGMDVHAIPYAVRLLGRNPIALGLWKHVRDHVAWADVVCLFSYVYEMNSRVVLHRVLGHFDKPLVHFYRGSLESEGLAGVSLTTRLAKAAWDASCGRLMFNHVDAVVSNSGPTLEVIRRRYGTPLQRLRYIKTGVDVARFPRWSAEHKRVLFIGRFVDNKGIHFFPRILEAIPEDWTFTTIGDGPLVDEVAALGRVDMRGKLSHADTLALLAASDILVLPTLAEGMPRAVLEASCCGVPSIAFGVGDVPNCIPADAGYAVEPQQITIFCERLRQLIADREQRQQMGRAARNFAEVNLDWSVIDPQLDAVLESVMSAAGHVRD